MSNEKLVERLERMYPEGARVKLIHMDDVQSPPPGTLGTVDLIDDVGTIHVTWDNGSTLGVAYGENKIIRI